MTDQERIRSLRAALNAIAAVSMRLDQPFPRIVRIVETIAVEAIALDNASMANGD
jgi:hypothetical protein